MNASKQRSKFVAFNILSYYKASKDLGHIKKSFDSSFDPLSSHIAIKLAAPLKTREKLKNKSVTLDTAFPEKNSS